MSLAAELNEDIAEALAEVGQTLTYNRVSDGAYVPGSSTVAQAVTSFTIKGVVEDLRDGGKGAGLNEMAHKKITVNAADFVTPPDRTDNIVSILDGKQYQMIDFDTVAVEDEAVLYTLYVRRG